MPLLCLPLLGLILLAPQSREPIPLSAAQTELDRRIHNQVASLQELPASLCQFMDTLTEAQRRPHVDIWIQALAQSEQWIRLKEVASAHRQTKGLPLAKYEQRSMRLVQAHTRLGEPREAIRISLEMASRGLKRHEDPALAMARNTQDWPYLQEVTDQVLQRDPAQPSALMWKAEALVMQGRMADAEPYLVKALVHKPAEVTLWANLAGARQMRGASAEALEAADKAIALDPHCMAAQRNRAAALMGLNRYAEARAALAQSLLVAKDPAQRADLQDLLARTDRYLAWQEKQAAARPAPKPARKAGR